MDEWVKEYVQMSEWASDKMNEVMIEWLNEEKLGERSLMMMYFFISDLKEQNDIALFVTFPSISFGAVCKKYDDLYHQLFSKT